MQDTTPRVQPPPAREPRPVTDEPALTGKRVIVAMEDDALPGMVQHIRDYRAASEVYEGADGLLYVNVAEEVQWYAWTTDPNPGKPERCPRAKAWPAESCWVE